MRYTQTEAENKLGLSRGAFQPWERRSGLLPVAIDACLSRMFVCGTAADFGPVTLLYADDPISMEPSASVTQHARAVRATSEQRKRLNSAPAEGGHDPLMLSCWKTPGMATFWVRTELLREIRLPEKNARSSKKRLHAKAPSSTLAKRSLSPHDCPRSHH